MRKSLVLMLLLLGSTSVLAQAVSPDALLDRGIASYKRTDFQSAVVDLQAAAQAFLSPEQMQAYVNTGRFERLRAFETSLVYLALSQFRLGREDDARETIVRLTSAERISPTYSSLALGGDASEFETLVNALAPNTSLPHNMQVAGAKPSTQEPERVAVKRTLAEEKAERQKVIDELVAIERERIQREADARVAAERAAAQKQSQEQIASAQAEAAEQVSTAQKQSQEQIAAAQAEAARRVEAARAAAEQQLAAARDQAQRDADARIAEIQKESEQRIAAERAAIERAVTAKVAEVAAAEQRTYLASLRQAEAFATNGQVDDANEIYARLAAGETVPREVRAEAAVGLYRTGAFAQAVKAFHALGTFARGEEDLRYYNAVSLYETGAYSDAQKELACALPFIQMTDDVMRYRTKIEQTAAQQARK